MITLDFCRENNLVKGSGLFHWTWVSKNILNSSKEFILKKIDGVNDLFKEAQTHGIEVYSMENSEGIRWSIWHIEGQDKLHGFHCFMFLDLSDMGNPSLSHMYYWDMRDPLRRRLLNDLQRFAKNWNIGSNSLGPRAEGQFPSSQWLLWSEILRHESPTESIPYCR